jgi:ABC-2 type transport system permease protein
MLGLIAAGYAIQAALRLRSEEASLRAEPVLATAVGRVRWACSHLAFSLLGPSVALATAGLTTGLAYGLDTGQVGREVPRLMGAALLQLPAVWLLAAVAVALFGLAPRFAAVAWAALAFCLVILLVGAAMRLGQWLLDLSPFTHLPKVPGGTVFATPLIWLLAVAVALGTAGLVGLRRRDMPVT